MYAVTPKGSRGIALAGIPEKGMSLASRRVGFQLRRFPAMFIPGGAGSEIAQLLAEKHFG